MGVLKRTLLNLIRKPGKTIIIFLLISVISTFLLSGFAIINAIDSLTEGLRSTVGGSVQILPRKELKIDGGAVQSVENLNSMSYESIEDLLDNENVLYVNLNNSGYVKSDHLDFVPGLQDTKDNNMGNVEALCYSALDERFIEKQLRLLKGRHIIDNDSNSILISEDLATMNNLKIGDNVDFTHADLEVEGSGFVDSIKSKTAFTTATVVGIYEIIDQQENAEMQPTAGRLDNLIYSDNDFLTDLEIAQKDQYSDGAEIFIKDPARLEEIVSEVSSKFNDDNFIIRKNDFEYKNVVSGLTSLRELVGILIVIVSCISVLILILVLAFRIRSRLHEAGVFLSVGIDKKVIITQFVLEILLISAASFALSYLLLELSTGFLENLLLSDVRFQNITNETLMTGVNSEIDVGSVLRIDFYKMLVIFGMQVVAIIVSVLVSSHSIIKLKPKEILSNLS